MKLNIILLAAGNSKRFGSNKLLYEIDGKPIYYKAVSSILEGTFGELSNYIGKIIIVSQYQEIKKGIENLPIIFIENNQSELGISHSIKLGLEFDLSADSYLFVACDQPYLTSETIHKFLRGYFMSGKSLGCLAYEERRGNPCIFDKKYLNELLQLTGDCGGREIRNQNIENCYQLQVEDEKELEDIDYNSL